ncbi:TPA: GNAT family N-acetyltransferase [Candidatus Poribacteria bacterium]|nr:GNAT family N-acetyltransferase [Candidatus Poribacteria bacterium]HEX28876.1 GNAT family N-acetyltransferase [Candidatus Poribacteria bacterium]
MKLREHKIILQGERVTLRPMTEDDWDILLRWNSDPDVLYFAEGDDVRSYSLEQIQQIYRGVSQNAFCFIIEVAGNPIGECWLQQMNLDPIEMLGGELPRKQQRLVEAWAELHQGELLENWKRLQAGQIPYKIAPLR